MPETPSYYVDQFQLSIQPYTVSFAFGQTNALLRMGAVTTEDQCVIRMSPQYAKVLALMLRRNLKNFERESGVTLMIPQNVIQQLGIPMEDW